MELLPKGSKSLLNSSALIFKEYGKITNGHTEIGEDKVLIPKLFQVSLRDSPVTGYDTFTMVKLSSKPHPAEIENAHRELVGFASRLGLESANASKFNALASVFGANAWLELNQVELENYKLAKKETFKTLSALLTRACGGDVLERLPRELYLDVLEESNAEIDAQSYIVYDALIQRLGELDQRTKNYVLENIAYDFLACKDKKHYNFAQVIICNL